MIPAAEGAPHSDLSVWSRWTEGQPEFRAYATARAALAALLTARGVRRLWLPAYGCRALMDGVIEAGVQPEWYGVDGQLRADIDTLRLQLGPRDAVLAIAWFGRPVDAAFHTLATDFPEVLFIEDRAQALDPGRGIEGAIRLYSPRKLLGVADGGLLTGPDLPPPARLAEQERLWEANEGRGADPDGADPSGWFPAYQSREAAFDARPRRCSDRTLSALRHIGIKAEAEARRRNWQTLAGPLDAWALWALPSPDFAPLAFPVVVSDAAGLVRHLADHRIWAARHWADLPSPVQFTEAHALSQACVSLPLDGRYDASDMHRIIRAVLAFAGPRP